MHLSAPILKLLYNVHEKRNEYLNKIDGCRNHHMYKFTNVTLSSTNTPARKVGNILEPIQISTETLVVI